ncbi:MAG: chemotaxis protein CheC [Bacillota bacterium]|nr:chemotaxis protein CheC [Bacillota bacterium]
MDIENLDQLNEKHIDVLSEIGNIGSGNAATSLSELMNIEVNLQVPQVRILDIKEAATALGGPENPVVAILMKLRGDLNGIMVFLINQDFVQSLLEALLCEQEIKFDQLTDLENSALAEIGNIMVSAYATAVSTLSGMTIRTSVPALTVDMVGAVLTVPAIEMGSVSDKVIFIENDFISNNRTINANMLLIPDMESLNKLMNRLGIGW